MLMANGAADGAAGRIQGALVSRGAASGRLTAAKAFIGKGIRNLTPYLRRRCGKNRGAHPQARQIVEGGTDLRGLQGRQPVPSPFREGPRFAPRLTNCVLQLLGVALPDTNCFVLPRGGVCLYQFGEAFTRTR